MYSGSCLCFFVCDLVMPPANCECRHIPSVPSDLRFHQHVALLCAQAHSSKPTRHGLAKELTVVSIPRCSLVAPCNITRQPPARRPGCFGLTRLAWRLTSTTPTPKKRSHRSYRRASPITVSIFIPCGRNVVRERGSRRTAWPDLQARHSQLLPMVT
jgi:hypothetical protein